MKKKRLRVAVLSSGWGEERQVSLETGRFVVKNLNKDKYHIVDVVVDDFKDIARLKGKVDFVFIALHGRLGEGGYVQAMLDLMGLPYSSASPLPSQIGMNKLIFKSVLKSEKVLTIDDIYS